MIYIIIIAAALFSLVFLNYVIPHAAKRLLRRRFLKWAESSGKIYLTFDDGPDITNTVKILDILKKHDIKVTFFVIGENAEKYPKVIKRMLDEKHTVCTHSREHLHPWKVLPWKAMADLANGNRILEKCGVKSRYVRPPYGKLNLFSLLYLLFHRLVFVHWNLDTLDYERSEHNSLAEKLHKEIGKGKVVLLHDGRRTGTGSGLVTVNGLDNFFKSTDISFELFSPLPVNGNSGNIPLPY